MNIPTDDEMDTGEWAYFEVRHRDPGCLTDKNAEALRSTYDRAECCWDAARYLAEIPRARRLGTKIIAMQPARFRLCLHHSVILQANDPEVTLIELGCVHE